MIKLFISFILSFLGSCQGPDTQTVLVEPEARAFIEFKLSADDLSADQALSVKTILEQRLAPLAAEVSWLGEQDFSVVVRNVVLEHDLKTLELATQQGLLSLRLVSSGSETLDTLRLSDLEESLFPESIFAKAVVETDDFGYVSLALAVKEDYYDALLQLSSEHLGRRLAIVIDETVLSAPVIRSQVKEIILLSGLQDLAEAEQLALIINSGPLPAALTLEEIFIQD